METIEVFALICAVLGIIGSVVPGLPGPPLSWIGLLLTFFAVRDGAAPMSTTFLLVWLGITTLVTVLDYVIPAWFTRVTGGHKAASVGAILGLFAGMFLLPVGMLVGSLLGAFLGEFLVEDKGVWESFKASVGAFLGFICSTGLKLVVSGIMMYHIIQYLF